jgi:hypothetical protein
MKNREKELTVHHHFAQYFKDKDLAPYLYVLSKRMENGHVLLKYSFCLFEFFWHLIS